MMRHISKFMKHTSLRPQRVLALFASTRGVGFTVLDGPWVLVDWGVKEASGEKKNEIELRKVQSLIAWYRPDVVIVEDYLGDGSRKCERVQRLIDAIVAHTGYGRIAVNRYSRSQIRGCFSQFDATTKHEISREIARRLPELQWHLPPTRKIWLPEDRRMSIFDAAALAFTFFHLGVTKKPALWTRIPIRRRR